jgi:hypothetical protein
MYVKYILDYRHSWTETIWGKCVLVEDNIEIDLKQIGYECVDWIHVAHSSEHKNELSGL